MNIVSSFLRSCLSQLHMGRQWALRLLTKIGVTFKDSWDGCLLFFAYKAVWANQPHVEEHICAIYSRLIYGDAEAIEKVAWQISTMIKHDMGDRLTCGADEYVIATASYYRTPSIASYMGKRVAELLNLPLVDVRRHIKSYEEVASRNCVYAMSDGIYCSNPNVALGRTVIYVDNVIASWLHLAEHKKAIMNANAAGFLVVVLVGMTRHSFMFYHRLCHACAQYDDLRILSTTLARSDIPIFSESVQLFLRLNSHDMRNILRSLPYERVYELCECASLEGYSSSDAYAELASYAETLHMQEMRSEDTIFARNFRLMLLDYDGTIACKNEPPSKEMCAELTFRLESGVRIGILTGQSIGAYGLEGYFLAPMREYLLAKGKSLALLQSIYLFPIYAAMAYVVEANGRVDKSRPLYNLGFSEKQSTAIRHGIRHGEIWDRANRCRFRFGSFSIRWETDEDFSWGKKAMTDLLHRLEIPGCVAHKNPKKRVLHIFPMSINKAIGRDYMLRVVRTNLERELGIQIPRFQILVAGDHMGTSNGQDHDSKMRVFGAVNLALGCEAIPGVYKRYQTQESAGLLAFLRRNRHYLETHTK